MPEIQQPNSETVVESFQESNITSFIICNGTPQKIFKEHKNLVPKKQDNFFDTKQRSPQEVENQGSIISFKTGIPRDSKY